MRYSVGICPLILTNAGYDGSVISRRCSIKDFLKLRSGDTGQYLDGRPLVNTACRDLRCARGVMIDSFENRVQIPVVFVTFNLSESNLERS